jgi:hypothetical protein
MLGGRCVFSGMRNDWEVAAAEGNVDLSLLQITERLSDALEAARSGTAVNDEHRRVSWRSLLGRLRR